MPRLSDIRATQILRQARFGRGHLRTACAKAFTALGESAQEQRLGAPSQPQCQAASIRPSVRPVEDHGSVPFVSPENDQTAAAVPVTRAPEPGPIGVESPVPFLPASGPAQAPADCVPSAEATPRVSPAARFCPCGQRFQGGGPDRTHCFDCLPRRMPR